ncbi:MAG: hypothetical protein AB1576_04380 [Bacillota bacterium]
MEIDLVAHDGGSAKGEYAQTLDVVDVATRWTETVTVKNKARKWVLKPSRRYLDVFRFRSKGSIQITVPSSSTTISLALVKSGLLV